MYVETATQEPAEKDKDLLNNYLVFIIFFLLLYWDGWVGGGWRAFSMTSSACTFSVFVFAATGMRALSVCIRYALPERKDSFSTNMLAMGAGEGIRFVFTIRW